jgi:hypothetical protein
MTTKNKVYLSFAVFALLGISLIIFLVHPVYKDIRANSEELILEKQTLTSLEAKIKNIEDFRKNYQETKENLEKTKNLFIKFKAPISFIYFLEKSAQASQIPLEIFPSQVKENKEGLWSYIVFKIDSASSFPNFLKFLEKLESSPYLIEIHGLTMSKLTEDDLKRERFENYSLGDVNVSLSIKVFAN